MMASAGQGSGGRRMMLPSLACSTWLTRLTATQTGATCQSDYGSTAFRAIFAQRWGAMDDSRSPKLWLIGLRARLCPPLAAASLSASRGGLILSASSISTTTTKIGGRRHVGAR